MLTANGPVPNTIRRDVQPSGLLPISSVLAAAKSIGRVARSIGDPTPSNRVSKRSDGPAKLE
jgi:hypothetical protein